MHRIKLLLGTTLLILIVFALTASAVHPQQDKIINPRPDFKRTLADKHEADLYNFHKKLLSNALNAYFKDAIASGEILGAGVSITKGDSILLADGFGKRALDEDNFIDGKTVFRLGSLSKGFTGVLAANLKAEGIMDWNDRVVDYLPEFKFGTAENTQKVTISNILSHTSGTPYHSFTNLVEAGLPMSTIATRFNQVQPISVPGEQYSYQNAMFALSQEVMLKATGEDIQHLLANRFFTPLGMSNVSTDHETLLNSKNFASPHRKRTNGWSKLTLTDRYDNAVAAGGINASSEDMAKWMRFLLGHHPEVMPSEAINEVFKPFISFKNGNKYYQRWPGHLSSSYGYGWRIHTFKDQWKTVEETMWHHGGSVNDFRNEIALFPESDLGICVLINSNSKLARTVIPDLHAIVKHVYEQAPSKVASL
ncbi:MAG: serine hydrolase domain-containing protein [Maribacter sp.]